MISTSAQIESDKFEYRLNPVDTNAKKFKIKKSEPSKKKKSRYPTQVRYIGNIRCLFFSYFKNGKAPLLSIGPSWPFTIGLLAFAFMAYFYFLWMLTLLKIVNMKYKLAAVAVMSTNVLALMTGILQNPGIP